MKKIKFNFLKKIHLEKTSLILLITLGLVIVTGIVIFLNQDKIKSLAATKAPYTPGLPNLTDFSTSLKGCQNKPIKSARVKLMGIDRIPTKLNGESDFTYHQYLIGATPTNSSGIASFKGQTLYFSKYNYYLEYAPNQWIHYQEPITASNYWKSSPPIVLSFIHPEELSLNYRTVNVANAEHTWGQSVRADYTNKAAYMSDNQLRSAIKDLSKFYYIVDRNKKVNKRFTLTQEIDQLTSNQLKERYVALYTEKAMVNKYRGNHNKFALWCTAFSTYVMRQAGGPNLRTEYAAFIYNWFNKGGSVKGLDGLDYKKSAVTESQIFALFAKNKSYQFTSGDYFLEKLDKNAAKDVGSSGHSAIITGNINGNSSSVTFSIMNGNGGSPWVSAGSKVFRQNPVPGYNLAAGKLQCYQP